MVFLFYSLLFFISVSHFVRASVTISGLSSGAAFAVQFHVAYSSYVTGAGIVAGIPYYCAAGDVETALDCMAHPDIIDVSALVDATTYAFTTNTIDDYANLANTRVYLYSGTNDTVVDPGTMAKVEKYYLNYMKSSSMKTVFDIPSEHAFVTKNYGNNCSYLGTPFINNCIYDQAGEILSYLYGTLNPAVNPISSNIITLGQEKYVPVVGLDAAGMAEDAYLYIPSNCANGGKTCKTHIAFHGCEQTLADINTTFVENAGYNGWAESNNIVIFYPQAKKNDLNPKGCWDWWGYTGEDYASQLGVQMTAVKNMADYIVGNYEK